MKLTYICVALILDKTGFSNISRKLCLFLNQLGTLSLSFTEKFPNTSVQNLTTKLCTVIKLLYGNSICVQVLEKKGFFKVKTMPQWKEFWSNMKYLVFFKCSFILVCNFTTSLWRAKLTWKFSPHLSSVKTLWHCK